jgi:cytochrome c oxidase subunit III
MATTLPPPQIGPPVDIDIDRELRPQHGNSGGTRGLAPEREGLRRVKDPGGEPARTGIWVALAAIAMMFAALTSALYVREGSATDWHHIVFPPILWLNTVALIASSVALELARRRVSAFMRGQEDRRSAGYLWLNVTMLLGLVFVVGQYLAWQQLRARGLYLPTNPNSSFFYVFTGIHVIHVVGGLGGLTRVMVKFRSTTRPLRRSTIDATSYYWHFMGLLWIYLLLVLWVKL